MKQVLLTAAILVVAPALAFSHHAMEYIEMESYTTAKQGEFVFHLHYDYMVDNEDNPNEDHWELTPGFSYGILDRLMVDVHTHFAKFSSDHIVEAERSAYETNGPSPFMEAVAASLQWRAVQDWLVDVAVVGTIEIPFSRAEKLLGSENNVYQGRLIVGKDFSGHRNITVNVAYEEEGDEDDTTWAIGAKSPLSSDEHGIAGGIEVMGSFDDTSDNWSILPGFYMPISAENVTLKTGLEFGKSDGNNTRRANLTLMYRF